MPNVANLFGVEFENIIRAYYKASGFEIIEPESKQRIVYYDFIAVKEDSKIFVECKHYRSRHGKLDLIVQSARLLKESIQYETSKTNAIIYVSCVFSKKNIEFIEAKTRVRVFDRYHINDFLSQNFLELKEKFERLLLESQQGLDIAPSFLKFQYIGDTVGKVSDISSESKIKEKPEATKEHILDREIGIQLTRGEDLYKKLSAVKCGKTQWGNYEKKCFDILKFLFEDDLALWNKQNNTEDGLSRFDLICRIASNDDFWRSLVSSFNSRFVLFEFKNYCNEIGPDQIYTTERYLFVKALRSVGIIISRKGGNKKAVQAAKGALKEHGKLIIILSDKDLENMLLDKDKGNSPSDYLANFLDEWLITISR